MCLAEESLLYHCGLTTIPKLFGEVHACCTKSPEDTSYRVIL